MQHDSAHRTFHDGVGLQYLLLNPRVLTTDGRQKLQDQLGRFGLPCPALPTDDHALVPLSPLHEVVGIVCNGKDVWGLLPNLFVFVAVDVGLVVDGKELVWVDCHQNGAGECLKG